MYDHPATQANLKTLESYGYQLIAPKESLLACGDLGRGAFSRPHNYFRKNKGNSR